MISSLKAQEENMTEEILNSQPEQELSGEEINALKRIRMDKLEALKQEGKNPFLITKYDWNILNSDLKAYYAKEEKKVIDSAGGDEEAIASGIEKIKEKKWRVAGRILSRRDMGKANFIDVQDSTERMQVYVRSNDVGDEIFADFESGISAISSALRALFSEPVGVKFPSTQPISLCFQSRCCRCPRSGTALKTATSATVSAMSISSSTPTSERPSSPARR